jgi:hypothetical protein
LWRFSAETRNRNRSARYRRGIEFRLEADHQLAAAKIEDRPLDHGRLGHHQRQRLTLIDALLVLVRQFLEGGAGAVEQRLPTDLLAPPLQALAVDAGGLVVMERALDALLVEPSARLLHRVAVLDAVDGDGHALIPTRSFQAASK